MANKSVYKKFTGLIGWNHLVVPDEYLDQKKWKMDFYPEDAKAFKDTGTRLKFRDDERGVFVKPSRDVTKTFKGTETKFEAPPITLEDGSEYDGMYIPQGSRVEVDLCFYDAGKFGTGTRIQGVKILELAEEEEREPSENQKLEAAEEPTTKKTPKKELPF